MPVTATMIDQEVDTIVLDDVDLDLPCEAETPCDNRAEWKVRVKCCNNMWLLCQQCVDAVIQDFVKHKSLTVRCAKCKKMQLMGNFVGSIERI